MQRNTRNLTLAATLLAGASGAGAEPGHRVYVTNEQGNTVSVIDTRTNQVEKTIEVGKRPRGIGLAPDGSELYVAVSAENAIAVLDPATLEVKRKFASGDDPETFAVHPNGNIYISNEDDAKASVFDPKSGKLIAEIQVGLEPEGVAISADGTRVIVTSESTNMLHVIGVPEHEVVANILVGARPRAATFSRDGKFAYATSEISGEVKRVDMATHEIVARKPLGDDSAKPKDVLLSPDEKTLYVAGGRANQIFVMDPLTLDIRKGVPVGKRVWGLALNKDGSRLYTTDGASDQVSIIDTAKQEVIATVPVGKAPWGVVVSD